MKSWRFHQTGSLDHLRLEEIPRPEPGPGEALVRLEFAALSPADRYLVEGRYPRAGAPPFAVGRDGCGVIESAPEDGALAPGCRVVVLRSDVGVRREGTLAEFVTVPVESLAPLPEGWEPPEGAAAPLVFLTAWQALVDEAEVQPGQTVLVTGASGGVGTAAVLLAKALGARVAALSRSAAKRTALARLGADHVFDASDPGLVAAVRRGLGGARCDAAVETLGGPFVQHALDLVGPRGRIAVVGLLAGLHAEVQVAPLLFKRARIAGVSVGDYTPAQSQAAWRGVVEALARTGARPVIDRVFAFDQVPAAFDRLAEGPLGKVLIAVAP